MGKRFTFGSLLPNKTYQKYFCFTTGSFKFTKELKLISKITCLEHHVIKTKIHAPTSHPIRALCLGVPSTRFLKTIHPTIYFHEHKVRDHHRIQTQTIHGE